MNKEKLLRNFLYYLLTSSVSFIIMFIMSYNSFGFKGAFLSSFFFSLIWGWFLIGALTVKFIKEISKDIKSKNKKNIIIWIVVTSFFIWFYMDKIMVLYE